MRLQTSAPRRTLRAACSSGLRSPEDVDQAKLATLAAERGFFYASGANFHIHGDEVPYLRLAFGHVPDDDIRDGIPILAQCLREARMSNEAAGFHGPLRLKR